MEHKTLKQLERLGAVWRGTAPGRAMSKSARLGRWAEALDRQRGRRLRSLYRVELVTAHEREDIRADDSPLTVAFEDPVLRAEGLGSDRLGEATRFFGLTDEEAHYIVCYCHYGACVSPDVVAARVRGTAMRAETKRAGRLRAAVTAGVGSLAVGVAILLL